jgi:hypothetical protein
MATIVELGPLEEQFESDDTPSVGPQRIQSSGWKPTPSPCASRGPHPIVDEPAQDFAFSAIPAGSMSDAQRQATEMHRYSLVVVLYNMLKTKNTFDVSTIAHNNLETLVVTYQREGSLWSFLMQAAYWGNEGITRWLFTHNADPFVRNASNQTALDVAVSERHEAVAEIIRTKMKELNYTSHLVRKDPASVSKPQQIPSPRR